jgi:hypothetical protein
MKIAVAVTIDLLVLAGLGCGSEGAPEPPAMESSAAIDEATTSGCSDDLESQLLDWNEPSPLGFSAEDVLIALGPEYRAALTYADGTATPLELRLAPRLGKIEYRGDVRDVSTRPRPPGYISTGSVCPSGLSFPVTLSFETDDGAFAEQWRFWLLALDPEQATGDGYPIDLDVLVGSYTVPDADHYDDLDAQLTATFGPGRWSGELAVVATTLLPGPTGADALAMIEPIKAATF